VSFAGDVALAAAERARRTLGPKVGLASYRALAENSAESETRGRATLEALRCALEAGDDAAVAAMIGLYASIDRGTISDEAIDLSLLLEKRGRALEAASLAALEAVRSPRARSTYVHARFLERTGSPAAPEAFALAEVHAGKEGLDDLVQSARARRVALSYERGSRDEASALEKQLVLSSVPTRLALRIAVHGLLSPSRFARASWLSELDRRCRAAETSDDERTELLRVACAHADRAGHALTPLETDRLFALFANLRDESLGAKLSARLRAFTDLRVAASDVRAPSEVKRVLEALGDVGTGPVQRALDVVSGRFEPKVALPVDDPVGLAIAAVAALRDLDPNRAEAALVALTRVLPSAAPGKRGPSWEAATLGLANDAESVRRDSLEVVRTLVRVGAALPSVSPGRGGVAVARACRAAGDDALAVSVLGLAVDAREDGATSALFETARELAWREAAAGRSSEALALLTVAKRLATST
jgi:hypothetical protein